MKLLLDQGLPHAAAHLLRQQNIDVLHVQDRGFELAEDAEILEYAGGISEPSLRSMRTSTRCWP
jgi:predicted nuclease of predicted toxin-antitoxin system